MNKKHPPITESVNRKYWENFNDDELEDYAQHLFIEARKYGFPYHELLPKHRAEMGKLLAKDYREFIVDGGIKQHMGGLGFLWSFFPHAWRVKCGNGRTVLDNFTDDRSLNVVIRKRLGSAWASNFSLPMLYKSLRMFNGAQAVSNFRPTAAAALYRYISDKYYDGKKMTVLDPSAGWGGRMYGAMLSNAVSEYCGIDPSMHTHFGLRDIKEYIESDHIKLNLSWSGSEEPFEFATEKFDFIFTSPPYYDTEKYADETSQSWVKFKTYDDWLEGFMRKTCINVKNACHNDTVVAWNIADTNTAISLIDDVDVIMRDLGFVKIDHIDYLISGRPNKSGLKAEPILIYKHEP